MKNFILIVFSLLSLIACGGGGGGGNANDGGFQRPIEPKVSININPSSILPNINGSSYESLTSDQIAFITVYARQGSTPLENGEEELHLSLNDAFGDVSGVIYCFEEETCTEEIDDPSGGTIKIRKGFSKVQLDLSSGRGHFAVTAAEAKRGNIGINVTVNGPEGSVKSKDIKIPVDYKSSGIARQIRISTSDYMRPNTPNTVFVVITDEAGNPVNDPQADNVMITANNLSGTLLSLDGETGSFVTGKTASGVAEINVLPTQTGLLTLVAQTDFDNNIENGIDSVMLDSKTINVSNDAPVITDIKIVSGSVPNGVVDVVYEDFTIATTGALLDFDLVSGQLPPGIQLSSLGVLSGTPTVAGEYSFVVRANGVNRTTDTAVINLTVVEGGFTFDRTFFDPLNKIVRSFDPQKPSTCENVGQILNIVPSDNYVLKPPFTWKMDAGGVQTALGQNKAIRVVNADGVSLPNLEFTVTDNTKQVTLNGKVCSSAPNNVFNGHAIILSAQDANGFEFESVLPLSINLTIIPQPEDDSDGGDDFSPGSP